MNPIHNYLVIGGSTLIACGALGFASFAGCSGGVTELFPEAAAPVPDSATAARDSCNGAHDAPVEEASVVDGKTSVDSSPGVDSKPSILYSFCSPAWKELIPPTADTYPGGGLGVGCEQPLQCIRIPGYGACDTVGSCTGVCTSTCAMTRGGGPVCRMVPNEDGLEACKAVGGVCKGHDLGPAHAELPTTDRCVDVGFSDCEP